MSREQWPPERRAAQAERASAMQAALTPEQLSAFGSKPKRRQAHYNTENLHRSPVTSSRAGKSNWTSERREAQRQRLAMVRLTGPAAVALGQKREAVKRFRAALARLQEGPGQEDGGVEFSTGPMPLPGREYGVGKPIVE